MRAVDRVDIDQIDDAFDLLKISLPWSLDELRIDDPGFDRSERKRRRRKLKRWYAEVAAPKIASMIDTSEHDTWASYRGGTHDTTMRPGKWSTCGYSMWDTCYVVDFYMLRPSSNHAAPFWVKFPLNQNISAWPAVEFAIKDDVEWTPGYLMEINEWAKRAIARRKQ